MIDYHQRQARIRADWEALLDRAMEVGDAAAASGGEVERETLRAFAALSVRLGEARFPLPFASASSAAAGFRHLARGFNDTGLPVLRAELGQAMACAARCCRRLLDRDLEETLEIQRRQRGEAD